MRRAMAGDPEKWAAHLKRAAANRVLTNISKYNKHEQSIATVVISAKQRCSNPDGTAWENYGGRGIKFRFDSVEHATRWIFVNLGPRPSGKYSIDRIDNNRHYEPGNLRWATTTEQARNKRAYRRTRDGERLRYLLAARPDYTRQGLARYVKNGWTDEHILAMKKPPGGRKRK